MLYILGFVAINCGLQLTFLSLLKPGYFEMDAGTPGQHIAILDRYSAFYWRLIWLALVAIVFVYLIGGDHPHVVPIYFMAGAILDAALFIGFHLYFYKGYLAARYPLSVQTPGQPIVAAPASSYSRGRYALVIALGAGAVIMFVCGVVSALAVL